MSNLKDRFLALLDEKRQQMERLSQEMQTLVAGIDWEEQMQLIAAQKDSLVKMANDLKTDFSTFVNNLVDKVSDFKVTIPFDSATEKMEWNVENGKLRVVVTFKDENVNRTSESLVTLPENCEAENITVEENTTKKTVTFTVPKKFETVNENSQDDNQVAKVVTKLTEAVTKNVINVAKAGDEQKFNRKEVDENQNQA